MSIGAIGARKCYQTSEKLKSSFTLTQIRAGVLQQIKKNKCTLYFCATRSVWFNRFPSGSKIRLKHKIFFPLGFTRRTNSCSILSYFAPTLIFQTWVTWECSHTKQKSGLRKKFPHFEQSCSRESFASEWIVSLYDIEEKFKTSRFLQAII